ncbi:MAG: TRM11 family methyltransferase [Candidatus Methanoperedens sp.]|nr:TRM11 family methyltransferase [Candidatus Methanoperedens sp.]
MLIAFELSGEHNTIPASEVLSCLRLLNADFWVCHSLNGCLVIDIKTRTGEIIEAISKRVAMTHHIIEVLGMGGPDEQEIRDMVEKNMPDFNGTYSVRVKRVRDYSKINTELMEGEIGRIFHENGKRANLKNPQMQYRVVLTEDKSIFGCLLFSIDRGVFESRKPHNKPFFYPGVLMPRVARALVNISMPREYLLDPFCGTGGILVEGGLIGLKVIGGDMQRKILLGAKMNLDHYNVDYSLMYEDACRLALRDESVDAVVTDPPYGRSAAIKAESLEYMLAISMKEIHRVLKNNKRAVFVSERPIEGLAQDAGFNVIEMHLQRIHKSLTRRILVLEKPD